MSGRRQTGIITRFMRIIQNRMPQNQKMIRKMTSVEITHDLEDLWPRNIRYIFMRVQNRFDPAVEAKSTELKKSNIGLYWIKSMSVSTHFPPWCDLGFIFPRHFSQIHLDRNKNRYTNIRVRVNWGHSWSKTHVEWPFLPSRERSFPLHE